MYILLYYDSLIWAVSPSSRYLLSILCSIFFLFSLVQHRMYQLYLYKYQDTNLHTFLFLSLDESALIFAHYLSKSPRIRLTARGKWLIHTKKNKRSAACFYSIAWFSIQIFSSFAEQVFFFCSPLPFSFVSNDACIIMESHDVR